MELLYVTVVGTGLGLLARYVLPHRETYGILLAPAVGAIATAVVWVGMLWLGFTFDGGWIWVGALAAGAVVPAVLAALLGRARAASDGRTRHLLSGGKA